MISLLTSSEGNTSPSVFLKLAFLMMLVAGTLQCFNPFAPALDENTDLSNVITDQATPGEVLQNFSYAYTFKDSLLYSDLLDEAFVFDFFNPDLGPTGDDETWARDEDLRITGRLFREFDVINLVWLNLLPPEAVEEETPYLVLFDLSLVSADASYVVSGTAVFTFRKNENDGKWRIVRWKDASDR